MPTPLLPRLNDSNSIAIARRGEWISTEQNSLANLIKSIKVTNDRQANVTSIPDLWAHPANVEMALFDNDNPKHKSYVSQWRGILAMLALYSARNIKELDIKSFIVPSYESLKNTDAPEFLKVLAGMVPDKIRSYEQSATGEYRIQIITFAGKPLAFVWPSIFVCPAIEIGPNDSLGSSVSWWRNYIDDPIAQLSDEEKVLLRDWLENAKKSVSINEGALLKLVQEFENDLKVDGMQVRFDDAKGLDFKGKYKFLAYNKMIPMDMAIINNSHVMLINQKQDPKLKNLLIIIPDMDEQWDIPASHIIIAGSVTFDTMKAFCAGGFVFNKKDLNGFDITGFAELRSSEDFFTSQIGIVYVPSDESQVFTNDLKPVIRTINGNTVNIILPLKCELLSYLKTSYIRDNVDVIVDGDDITVTLNLPLTGINGERKLKVSKTYTRTDQQIRDFVKIPLIQIWPNFIVPEPKQNERSRWEAYYSFFSAQEGWERAGGFYARPFWEDSKIRKIEEPGSYAEMIRGTKFPEAYICYSITEETSGEKQNEIGLVMLNLARTEKIKEGAAVKKYQIGVDFGTTNTVSYCRVDGNTPELMSFKNRMYSVTDITRENKDDLRRYFFSTSTQPASQNDIKLSSIRSIFHVYPGSADVLAKIPMMSGNIYYLENGKNIDDDGYLVENNSLHDDIKWNQTGIYDMTAFLIQYTMQCLAEAVVDGATEVEWSYSYPKAFTDIQKSTLSNIWENAISTQLDAINGISKKIDSSSSRAESIAMAEYFYNKMNGDISRGMVCFDIGGGSTDVAIWQGTATAGMRYQCSLKFAGKHLLNEYLFAVKEKNKALLMNLKSTNPDYSSLLNSVNEATEKDFNFKLEALLKYYEKEIFDLLPPLCATKSNEITKVARDIAFGLAGIFYYVGKIISYLRTINNYEEMYKFPECYVGGNASKLLNWAAAGRFNEQIADRFAQVFSWGVDSYGELVPDVSWTDITYHARVNKTIAAKEEVAYGLVEHTYITKNNQNHNAQPQAWGSRRRKAATFTEGLISDILAGEKFVVDGVDIHCDTEPNTDVITKDSLISSIVRVNEKCPEFREFVAAFNDAFASANGIFEPINLNEMDYSQISQNVNKELLLKHNDGQENRDNIVVEPLFIMVLKESMKRLALK